MNYEQNRCESDSSNWDKQWTILSVQCTGSSILGSCSQSILFYIWLSASILIYNVENLKSKQFPFNKFGTLCIYHHIGLSSKKKNPQPNTTYSSWFAVVFISFYSFKIPAKPWIYNNGTGA